MPGALTFALTALLVVTWTLLIAAVVAVIIAMLR